MLCTSKCSNLRPCGTHCTLWRPPSPAHRSSFSVMYVATKYYRVS